MGYQPYAPQQPPAWQGASWPLPPPTYAQPAAAPRPSPLRFVLLGLIALTVLAIGALAVVGLGEEQPVVVPYVNDDHEIPPPDAEPPPLPVPTDPVQAEQWMTANAIYDQQMPAPIRCDVPRLSIRSASDADLESHFNQMTACLVRAWEVPATAAGFTVVRARVTVYGSSITTQCGETGINAFYCTLDQQIYFSSKYPQRQPTVADGKVSADVVLAHEFGHAMTARTGIWKAFEYAWQQEPDQSAQLVLNRRMEAQADCFSGAFARSVSRSLGLTQDDLAEISQHYYNTGADIVLNKPGVESTHPLSTSRRYWGLLGLSTADLGVCNTFSAPAHLVR